MQISWLQAFLFVEEFGSFSVASKKLHMSQSALSKHISSLENLIGTELFVRSSRGVMLTPAGESLVPYAMSIVDRNSDMLHAMRQYLNVGIRVVYVPVAVLYGYHNIFHSFSQKYPKVKISIRECEIDEALGRMYNRTADFALMRLPRMVKNDMNLWKAVTFHTDTFVAVCHANHPIASLTTVNFETICREKLILFNTIYMELLQMPQFNGNFHSELLNPAIITRAIPFLKKYLLGEGGDLWVTILERRFAEYIIGNTDLCIKEIADIADLTMGLVGRDRSYTLDGRDFVQYVKKERDAILHVPQIRYPWEDAPFEIND